MDAIAPKLDIPPRLIGGWTIEHWVCYLAAVLLLAFAIRLILSALKACVGKTRWPKQSFCAAWRFAFCGVGRYRDYWQPFFLGVLELGSFPILMATENWSFVGAWVGFKVVAQATLWKERREVFSRFLIGTALGLITSFVLASTGLIVLKSHCPEPIIPPDLAHKAAQGR